PVRHGDRTVIPLTRRPGGIHAFKTVIPGGTPAPGVPDPKTHEGYEWLYVLNGRLRLVLGDHDIELGPGEAAEFDTRVPHWFERAGADAVEFLSLFGKQGERVHLRARPSRPGDGDQTG
ncbi:MAG: cupin domain-containing protein, partial [Actinobacteria bacterium]|nr:cupin domain-containing protein [Actinomycetota bacterium]